MNSQRSTRGSLPSLFISEISSSCSPGDETVQIIDDFHEHIRIYGRSYAPRFPRALLDAIFERLRKPMIAVSRMPKARFLKKRVPRSVLALTLRLTLVSNVALDLNLDLKNLTN